MVLQGRATRLRACVWPNGAGTSRLHGRVNAFIRESGKLDGVIHFTWPCATQANPLRFLPAYDSGDHLHSGDAGYAATAEAVV